MTPDPLAQLDAATEALHDAGELAIEVLRTVALSGDDVALAAMVLRQADAALEAQTRALEEMEAG